MRNEKPKKGLREIPLKRGLKSFLIPHIANKYEVAGIRVLWKKPKFNNLYEMRMKLEHEIKNINEIVLIISCFTGIEERKQKGNKPAEVMLGFAFWMAFIWPEHALETFEDQVCGKLMKLGVNINSCKSLRVRGNFVNRVSMF